jgi:hypothetical protein
VVGGDAAWCVVPSGRDWEVRERGTLDDTLGGYSLTLIDSLDMLAVLGDFDRYRRTHITQQTTIRRCSVLVLGSKVSVGGPCRSRVCPPVLISLSPGRQLSVALHCWARSHGRAGSDLMAVVVVGLAAQVPRGGAHGHPRRDLRAQCHHLGESVGTPPLRHTRQLRSSRGV